MEATRTMAVPEDATQLIRLTERTFSVPGRPSMISVVRNRVRRFARKLPFTQDQLDDICIAVGEAATNAIKHGKSLLYPHIDVKIQSNEHGLTVFISDKGPGFDPCGICPPAEGDLCECGRGIMCMRSLMDEVVFHHLEPGTCVEMTKFLTPARA